MRKTIVGLSVLIALGFYQMDKPVQKEQTVIASPTRRLPQRFALPKTTPQISFKKLQKHLPQKSSPKQPKSFDQQLEQRLKLCQGKGKLKRFACQNNAYRTLLANYIVHSLYHPDSEPPEFLNEINLSTSPLPPFLELNHGTHKRFKDLEIIAMMNYLDGKDIFSQFYFLPKNVRLAITDKYIQENRLLELENIAKDELNKGKLENKASAVWIYGSIAANFGRAGMIEQEQKYLNLIKKIVGIKRAERFYR